MRRVQEEQECLGAALQAIRTNTTNVKCLMDFLIQKSFPNRATLKLKVCALAPWIITRPAGPIQRDLWR